MLYRAHTDDMEMTQLIESLEFRFSAAGIESPKRVTEELLAHVLNCKPLEVYTRKVPDCATTAEKVALLKRLEPLVKRIEEGEPIQYVLGHVDFWGLEIKCDPRALIPRPETELLVEEVLSSRVWDNNPATVVDVGTGTGCIILTLATQRPDGCYKAVDISPVALTLAKENAQALGLEGKVLWLENSLLERFAPESCDAVVANLPYIASNEWQQLADSVRDFEPHAALKGGADGMDYINELATQARYVLIPGGMLFLEFGFNQGEAVYHCLKKLNYQEIQIKKDLAGHDRIAIAVNP